MEEEEEALPNGLPFEQLEIVFDIEITGIHDDRKRNMLKSLGKFLGVVQYASNETGIPRRTHYNWLKSDEGYKEIVELIDEVALDYTEARLLSSVKKRDLRSIFFVLKTRGKDRGYGETNKKVLPGAPIINVIAKDEAAAASLKRVINEP